MSPRVRHTHHVFGRLACLVLCFTLQFPVKDKVLSVYITSPSRGDFTNCTLTMEQKEKFLFEHNKFRGMVDPPAADMEYLVGTNQITGKTVNQGANVACNIYTHGKRFLLECVFS